MEESPPVRREPELFIHADGASRGNPGEAGAGVVILDGRGRTVRELKRFLGLATNNFAEYQALILALEEALELGAGSVRVHLDSELAVRQIGGEYQVRNAGLKPVHRRVLELLEKFARAEVVHVPREKNRRADQLANEAIDEKDSTRE
ncbi:MAG: ribonuclease HI family protein [Deltaproteobacteria bacterium]|nr:ribonuclease HI family protein [Deltaproteobacteria bacterium]